MNKGIKTTIITIMITMSTSLCTNAKTMGSLGDLSNQGLHGNILYNMTASVISKVQDSSFEYQSTDLKSEESTSVINFPDKNFEKVIRNYINKPTGDILKSDVENIRWLIAYNSNITDISGIENLTNLRQLFLSKNQIRDISPLKEMTNLTDLSIDENQISNIEVLRGLTNLQKLYLSNNPINSIEPISGLTDLICLGLGGDNQITDISPLKRFTKLIQFSFNGCDLNKTFDVYDKADQIIKSIITPEMSELQKEKAVHDYIVLNSKYNYTNYINNTISSDDANAYGILVKGTVVCEGFASATQLLLNKAGLYCITIHGNVDRGGHAWNIVKVDGKYRHVDTTFDLTNRPGIVGNQYFNLSDNKISLDHKWDTSKYPICSE